MRGGLTPALLALRAVAFAAIALLVVDPPFTRRADVRPVVLLDASLSMAGHGGAWRAALDSARRIARGGVIWRFGADVAPFDSSPPHDGASRLGPALRTAAARGGPVVVVTDGEISDRAGLPPDLLRAARVVVLPRAAFPDAFVASVDGPARVQPGDTIVLDVTVGTAGPRLTRPRARVLALLGDRTLADSAVRLPDSGTVALRLAFAAARLPPGWSAVTIRLRGAPDAEPRDDAREYVVGVTPEPEAVVLAAPPDWDTKFLAATLGAVADVPVRSFVSAERGSWRDAATLAPVGADALHRSIAAARLVVLAGAPDRLTGLVPPRAAVLEWRTGQGEAGDWYLSTPVASPLAGALAGVAWDSLAPAELFALARPPAGAAVVLDAAPGRAGGGRPAAWVTDSGGRRRAVVSVTGLYRWAFRGGAPGEAYRALVAGLADWLLAPGTAGAERLVPLERAAADGAPIEFRWAGGDSVPRGLAVRFAPAEGPARVDTLAFDLGGRARVTLPPGVYRYAAAGATGMVAVDPYSDEWRPAAVTLASQPGDPRAARVPGSWRELWWLYALAIAALAAEWLLRRRAGLP